MDGLLLAVDLCVNELGQNFKPDSLSCRALVVIRRRQRFGGWRQDFALLIAAVPVKVNLVIVHGRSADSPERSLETGAHFSSKMWILLVFC